MKFLVRCLRKSKSNKTVNLLTERIENGTYIREYQTFTLKEYLEMLNPTKPNKLGFPNVKKTKQNKKSNSP